MNKPEVNTLLAGKGEADILLKDADNITELIIEEFNKSKEYVDNLISEEPYLRESH